MVRDCYKEILKLKDMLDTAGIPYSCVEGHCNGIALAYPDRDNMVCSAIEHDYSYGGDQDLIEIMGLLTDEEEQYDSVKGHLSADDVFSRIKKHWEDNK